MISKSIKKFTNNITMNFKLFGLGRTFEANPQTYSFNNYTNSYFPANSQAIPQSTPTSFDSQGNTNSTNENIKYAQPQSSQYQPPVQSYQQPTFVNYSNFQEQTYQQPTYTPTTQTYQQPTYTPTTPTTQT